MKFSLGVHDKIWGRVCDERYFPNASGRYPKHSVYGREFLKVNTDGSVSFFLNPPEAKSPTFIPAPKTEELYNNPDDTEFRMFLSTLLLELPKEKTENITLNAWKRFFPSSVKRLEGLFFSNGQTIDLAEEVCRKAFDLLRNLPVIPNNSDDKYEIVLPFRATVS